MPTCYNLCCRFSLSFTTKKVLAAALMTKPGVKNVYVLKEAANTVLLPKVNGAPGGHITQRKN
jgi:hypothetical protein